MKLNYLFACALMLTTYACSPQSPGEKPQGVLTETQKKTLQKAKETEDVIKKADEERRKQLDENTEQK